MTLNQETKKEDKELKLLSKQIDKAVVKYYGLPNDDCEMNYAAYTLSREFKRIFLNQE